MTQDPNAGTQIEPADEAGHDEPHDYYADHEVKIASDYEGHVASRLDPDAEPVLEVDNLKMYFPVKSSGLLRRTIGHVQAVDGVSFQVPRGRLARSGGRVRLRQVHDRPADHPALHSPPAAR